MGLFKRPWKHRQFVLKTFFSITCKNSSPDQSHVDFFPCFLLEVCTLHEALHELNFVKSEICVKDIFGCCSMSLFNCFSTLFKKVFFSNEFFCTSIC